MPCPDLEQLEALACEDLTESLSLQLRSHLDACPDCRQQFDDVSANLQVSGSIARLAEPAVRTAPAQAIPHLAGYRVLREIGRGGSGIVYEAEQEQPRRRVAVKVFHGRTLDEYHLRLFQREAEALARLKHPAIAAIHAADGSDSNLQYFVMELVEGVQLGRFAARGEPTLQARLDLFRRICDAVHYAHQRGVIHRDLKPSNIIVTPTGNPKILDFGLSRITDDERDEHTIVTEVGRIQGTLHYMSPEQARGNPDEIDLRTDVYALGIILFQLLTLRLPYEVDRTQLLDALRVICEQDPVRPRTLNPRIDADLEAIILKAIEKDPARRYQSAAAMNEDIERYLGNEPILATPHTFGYQLRKLVARHKAPFAAAGVLFGLVLAFGAWMGVLYRQAETLRRQADADRNRAIEALDLADTRLQETRRAQTLAEEEAEKVTAINEFLRKILASADPTQGEGGDVRISEMLTWAAPHAETEFAENPEIRAGLQHTLGTAFLGLGKLEQAEETLRQALDTRVEVLGEDHDHTQITMNNYASALQQRGKLNDAEYWKRRLLTIRQRLLGPNHRNTRAARSSLGNLLQSLGRLDEAEALLRETLAGLEETQPDALLTLGTRNSLALLLWEIGKSAEAEPLLRQTEAGLAERFGDEHPHTLSVRNNLALVLKNLGRQDEAIALMRSLLEIRERVLGENHPDTLTSRHNLASSLLLVRELDEAETLARQTLAARRADLGLSHEETMLTLSLVGEILLARGETELALEHFTEALAGATESLPENHWRLGDYQCRLGTALLTVGRPAEAEPLLLTGVKTLRDQVGDEHPYTQRGIGGLVDLYQATDQPAQHARWQALHKPAGAAKE